MARTEECSQGKSIAADSDLKTDLADLYDVRRKTVNYHHKDTAMKPITKIDSAQTPDGGAMVLFRHDRDFSITVNGEELMLSRHHESELELARLGCAHLLDRKSPCILIGGLGMGYTLRQTLDMLSSQATVMVGELMGAVVNWNREILGVLNDHPLADKRVEVKTVDIIELISCYKSTFDAVLLDIDNGPSAITDSGNSRLYDYEGILACRRALSNEGCLAVWSAHPSKEFEQLLMSCSFHVRRFRVPLYKGSKSLSRFVWVASENKASLPAGAGKPCRVQKNESKRNRRQRRL